MASDEPITWRERVENLRKALGREPTLEEALLLAPMHARTPEEIEAQQQSLARHNVATGDPRLD